MLTIFAALKDEIQLIRSEMEIDTAIHIRPFAIITGKYQNRKIALVRGGVGGKSTNKSIDYLIENLKPSMILNIGYAGGLDPHLNAGDIVIASRIINEATEKSWDADAKLLEKACMIAEKAELRHHTGRMVTVESPVADPHQKAFVGTRFEASACDMESSFIAEKSSRSGIPFLVVRSVLDPLDTVLPDIPESAIIDGNVKIGDILKHLRENPKDIIKLPRFSYLCSQARISITKFAEAWVRNEDEY